MDEEDKLLQFVTKAFPQLARINFVPFFSKSLVLILDNLVKLGIRERDVAIWMELFIAKATLAKSEALDLLDLNNHDERIKVSQLLEKVNIEKAEAVFSKSPEEALNQINSSFQKHNMASRVAPEKIGILFHEIRKIKYANNAIYNVKLIMSHGLVEEVLPYTGRYINAQIRDTQTLFDRLAEIRAQLAIPLLETEELKKQITTILLNSGHNRLSMENKDIVELSEIILRLYLGIKAITSIREGGTTGQISRSLLSDRIALEIVIES